MVVGDEVGWRDLGVGKGTTCLGCEIAGCVCPKKRTKRWTETNRSVGSRDEDIVCRCLLLE